MYKHNHVRRHGFTIIELIVVVIIIGILSTIGIVTYNQIQKQSRDSKRMSDVTIMQNEIDKYYSQTGDYPSKDDTTFFGKLTSRGVVDQLDKPEWTYVGRNKNTGYCTTSVRWGGGEGNLGPSCRNYAYFNGANNTGFGDDGQYFTGCNVTGKNAALPWYVIMWYSEETGTILYKGGNISIATNAPSKAFPGQKCELQS